MDRMPRKLMRTTISQWAVLCAFASCYESIFADRRTFAVWLGTGPESLHFL